MHKPKLDIIGIIGVGNMGEAILSQSVEHKKQNFIIVEKNKLKEEFTCRKYRVRAVKDVSDLAHKAGVIVIAVKPQDIDWVLEELSEGIKSLRNPNILIISIAAGITTAHIEEKLHNRVKVIRAMPNIPARIGEGVTALIKGRFANSADLKRAEGIFRVLGETVIIKNEGLIDAVTALSGSGPAYFFFIFAAMLAAAEGMGLNKKDANKLIYHTVIGSMGLLKIEDFNAETLISKVASKGGTTEAALKIFRERGLKNILTEAIIAARNRARELSR